MHTTQIEGILSKGPYPPCLRMANRALLAGYPRNSFESIITRISIFEYWDNPHQMRASICLPTFSRYMYYVNLSWVTWSNLQWGFDVMSHSNNLVLLHLTRDVSCHPVARALEDIVQLQRQPNLWSAVILPLMNNNLKDKVCIRSI